MKVLCLANLYPNCVEPIRGNFVESQVFELSRQGCNIKVVAPVPLAPWPLYFLRPKWKKYRQIPFLIQNDIEVFHPRYLLLPGNRLFHLSGHFYLNGIKKLINRLFNNFKFDLIHAHTALPDGFAAERLGRYYQKPVVITVHGRDVQSTINLGKKCRLAVKEALENASAIITVSQKLAALCKGLTNRTDINVINNGIDPDGIVPNAEHIRKHYPGMKIILSVGTLRPSKGHSDLLKAMPKIVSRNEQLKLLIIGGGEEENSLRRLAFDLNIADKIEFLGALPHRKVMEYMAACDLFVLPSWSEGFGIVYLEAMASGKPVIACQNQGIRDVISSGTNGILIEERNIDALAENIIDLLSDEIKATLMGHKARETVLQQYTWQENGRKTIEVYKKVLEGWENDH